MKQRNPGCINCKWSESAKRGDRYDRTYTVWLCFFDKTGCYDPIYGFKAKKIECTEKNKDGQAIFGYDTNVSGMKSLRSILPVCQTRKKCMVMTRMSQL